MNRGYSLIEVAMGFLLMALAGGLLLAFYARMFGATRSSDTQMYAASQLDGVTQIFRHRAKENWPSSVSVTNATLEDFTYDVDDLGLVANPITSTNPITLKRIVVRLRYQVRRDNGQYEQMEISSSMLVGR